MTPETIYFICPFKTRQKEWFVEKHNRCRVTTAETLMLYIEPLCNLTINARLTDGFRCKYRFSWLIWESENLKSKIFHVSHGRLYSEYKFYSSFATAVLSHISGPPTLQILNVSLINQTHLIQAIIALLETPCPEMGVSEKETFKMYSMNVWEPLFYNILFAQWGPTLFSSKPN